MIPSFFIELDELPLLPNGKINRNLLINMDLQIIKKITEKPSTETEEKMIEIFQNILNSGDIGINDNFFDLGGHSLLAMQLISRIREIFDKEINLDILFEKNDIK
jgi:surfactin family lipopeptide synthetase A